MSDIAPHPPWRIGIARFLVSAVMLVAVMAAAQSGGKSPSASELPPGSADLIQPEDLVKLLHSDKKPTVLYVGPRFLYSQAHIPGAEFIGSAADAEFMEKLRKRAAPLPRNSTIVLYCGCCPWDHCPNIRPAHKELQKMGFTSVKALYLANSFGTNWVEKGYPAEKENSGR
jgi:thiosulfate/3-mercaptopyruvate sulfurtransferase